jgi:transcription termination/antitermination protein NusG
MAKEWFVVHTYSGYEEKVKGALDNKIKSMNLEDKIAQVVVPKEDVMDVKGKKKTITERKVYPGYILIEMEMDTKIWHVVKSTPGITGFVGPGKRPMPLTSVEVENILKRKERVAAQPVMRFRFEKNETVRITEGPFANFTGVVEEVSLSRGKLKVLVTIFGRATPVELEFSQVQKL